MKELWGQLEVHKLHEIVFCNGGVVDADSFVNFFRQQSNLFHIITMHDDLGAYNAIGAFMWLNGMKDNHALWHGCAFPKAWGKHTVPMGLKSFEYWFNIKKDDGYLFDTLICEVPAWNEHTLNYTEKIGAKKVGAIPNIANNIYTKEKSDRGIFYKEREE
jgi:hypothetical protein